MLQRGGVRLLAEVVLIVAAAAIAGPVLHLGAFAIIGVIVLVWAAIAVFEYGRAHPQTARPARARPARPGRVAPADPAGDDEAAFEGVRVLGSRPAQPPRPPRPEAQPARQPAPEPLPEPVVAVAVTAAAEAAVAAPPPLPPEPEPEPVAAAPEPELEPEPEPESALEPAPVGAAPWSWNVWNLERVVRERAASNDELNYLLLYLREYANPAGMLPPDFDALVRESFGDLLAAPS
jgi:hypothetical protein